MTTEILTPDYIFEASWEVCNKVGGIYTVLSTRAKTLQDKHKDRIIFIGPDLWADKENPLFTESDELYAGWKQEATHTHGLKVRTGHWNIPGKPIVILVDFTSFYPMKNEIYAKAWEEFGIDSLHAYGDYDEASMFSYAAGKVVESFYRTNLSEDDKVIYQAHEWMTGMGTLYLQKEVPAIATIFTTHATSVGRSIAGNNKPLYSHLHAYNGDQMALELNISSKHSVEKQTAHRVDCFTTVSQITNNECKELLDKAADVVLVNGFEDDFVPKGSTFTARCKKARAAMLKVANNLLGTQLDNDTLIVGTSGRYEFKNKGIDVFIESLHRLSKEEGMKRNVLAFINVPGWIKQEREDLKERMASKEQYGSALENPVITHWLHEMEYDQTLGMLKHLEMNNAENSRVKVIFVPCYLDGNDGIFNLPYYDLIIGNDISVYPSYYEPWGYTPLESIAFHVPTVTTDLAGFGLWVNSLGDNRYGQIESGVEVIRRHDNNYGEVANRIKEVLASYLEKPEKEIREIRKKAAGTAEKALWKCFIRYYDEAYEVALRNAKKRLLNN